MKYSNCKSANDQAALINVDKNSKENDLHNDLSTRWRVKSKNRLLSKTGIVWTIDYWRWWENLISRSS